MGLCPLCLSSIHVLYRCGIFLNVTIIKCGNVWPYQGPLGPLAICSFICAPQRLGYYHRGVYLYPLQTWQNIFVCGQIYILLCPNVVALVVISPLTCVYEACLLLLADEGLSPQCSVFHVTIFSKADIYFMFSYNFLNQ